MASKWHQSAIKKFLDGTLDIDTDTFKIMLVDSTYADDVDNEFVDDGTADDPASHELSATNYTGAFGGAGRKSATITLQANDTSDRVDIAVADLTWSTLGGASNDTIGGALLIHEDTDDTATSIVAFFDLTDTATNGGDITLDFATLGNGGNLRITV